MAEPSARRPNVVVLVLVGIVALALVAVIIGVASGGDDDDTAASTTTETRAVEVAGDELPTLADPAEDPTEGDAAPVLTGETFAGDPITIPRDGRPAVVVFLAHWCPHCQREVPVLVDHFADGLPDDVDVFGVATSIDPARPNHPPSAWLEREGWDIPTLYDSEDDAAARAYGLGAYPFFVVIDGDGRVVARTSGELDASQLDALLNLARSA